MKYHDIRPVPSHTRVRYDQVHDDDWLRVESIDGAVVMGLAWVIRNGGIIDQHLIADIDEETCALFLHHSSGEAEAADIVVFGPKPYVPPKEKPLVYDYLLQVDRGIK